MSSIRVKLYDRRDDEVFILVPVGPQGEKARLTLLERLFLWWSGRTGKSHEEGG